MNNVYEEVEDMGQKAISTRWVITEKVKGREMMCKVRLVARGFEEEMAEWGKDAPTCNAETLKFCLTVITLKKWTCYTLDVKTAYLQGNKIQREVYLKPPNEGNWSGLWKLKKTLWIEGYSKAWTVMWWKYDRSWEEREADWNLMYFFWKNGNKLNGILCSHVDDFCYGGN